MGAEWYEEVWNEIQGKQEIWDLIEKSKQTFSQVRLEPGQSLMNNKLVKQAPAFLAFTE